MRSADRTKRQRRPTVYGYVRVSSAQQAERGMSIRAQSQLIGAAAKLQARKHGLALGPIFRDPAVSATRTPLLDRRGGSELNGVLLAGDHVIFAKLDRAFRNARDCLVTCEAWISRGVTVQEWS